MTAEDIWAVFYKNMDLIEDIDRMIYYYRIQNLDRALRITNKVLKSFSEAVPMYAQIEEFINDDMIRFDLQYVSNMLEGLLSAQEKQDYELLPDLYELQMLPFINDIQGKIILSEEGVPAYNRYLYKNNYRFIKEKMPELAKALNEAYIPQRLSKEGYTAELTSSGLPTLKVKKDDREYYLHSNGFPMKEANLWAQKHRTSDNYQLSRLKHQEYDEKGLAVNSGVYEYIVYGIGLGYHIKALSQADPHALIKVFESDINILQLLCSYGDMGYFVNNDNIEIIHDPEFKKLNDELIKQGEKGTERSKFLVHYPSLCLIKSPFMKQKIENYFIQYSSVSNQLVHLNGNFAINSANYDAPADELSQKFEGKDLYIVAAGPSLDKNYKKLADVRENGIILATSTVFHKLMDEGIRPDYMIVTDASPRVVHHIRDYEGETVPLILLSTACKSFGQRLKGKKYLMLQKGYTPAENMAKKLGRMLFETGGSVSTAALDLGLRLKCKRIIFLGLDLSFPGDFAHAEGTSKRKATEISGLREVRDIDGGMVKTSKSMDMYREWIENRLAHRAKEETSEVIDATEGGALINGMKIMPLEETFEGEKKKRILVFKGTAKYGVMRQFADKVIEGMEDCGARIVLFDAKRDPAPKLMELVEKDYDMVFAFNGIFTSADLPASVIEKLTMDGRNKCFSWFVDHPCHHDTRLRVFPKNNVAAFVDREHVELTKEYFKEINPVFLPHGGDVYKGKIRPWEDRSIDVLFCGSCYGVSEYDKTLEGMEPFLRDVLKKTLEYLKDKPSLTVRQAMTEALLSSGVDKERINFGEENMLRLHRFVDDYIRTWFRQKVLCELANAGIKVTVCGDGWDKMASFGLEEENRENLIMLGSLGYEEALSKMADAKIILNVMPWFKDGSHERVFTAMRNQAVCLTDESIYLKEELKDYKSVQFYSLDDLSKLKDKIKNILSGNLTEDGRVVDMSFETVKGKEFADRNHSWQCRGRSIMEYLLL